MHFPYNDWNILSSFLGERNKAIAMFENFFLIFCSEKHKEYFLEIFWNTIHLFEWDSCLDIDLDHSGSFDALVTSGRIQSFIQCSFNS